MSLLDQFRTPAQLRERYSRPYTSFKGLGKGVGHSKDLERIKALPRRPVPSEAELEALVKAYSDALGKKNKFCGCRERFGRPCVLKLRPVQAWALHELTDPEFRVGNPVGLFGAISVGGGKSLLDLLAAMIVPDCKTAVLFVPANLRAQMEEIDIEYYGQHWELPNIANSRYFMPGRPTLHIVSYSVLQSAKSTDLLERIRPDLIIADEGHNLKAKSTVRSRRFLTYFKAHPKTRFAVWSGTLTSRSIKDYGHLIDLALGDGSPLPRSVGTLEEWARVLDPSEMPADPGALIELGPGTHEEAFSSRLTGTKGVVHTSASDGCNASLIISRRDAPPMPDNVRQALIETAESWTRPDGEEMTDVLAQSKLLRQLSYGFYYRWVYPRGEDPALINAWFDARQAWNRELRAKLKYPRPFLDSPLWCTRAAIRHARGDAPTPERPTWAANSWAAWRDIRDQVEPETETVWLSTWLAEDAAKWANEGVGIVWYEWGAFGRKVARLGKLPLFGGGSEASSAILIERGDRSIVASIKSHGTGKNLQHAFNRSLVANIPSGGQVWEQLMGRTHRQGQEADEVSFDLYNHTDVLRDAFREACAQASYVAETLRTPQKLLLATQIGL